MLVLGVFAASLLMSGHVAAITPLPDPNPEPDSYGLEAEKPQPPPNSAATIVTPNNGASYTSSPITVSGLCGGDTNSTDPLLVEVYDNDVLVGSEMCSSVTSGSFSLQVSLFTGANVLTTQQFDNLNQPSTVTGNSVTVSYNNASFQAFGTLITLTSDYGRRAADPGQTLTWPILLSGGTGPYAFSIDWGDGSPAQLLSQPLAGTINLDHVYNQSGIYQVTVRVTDVNGVSAFLQLVAVANGQPSSSGNGSGSANGSKNTVTITKVTWWPAVVCLILLFPTFWLGRRSELISLHRKLEKDAAKYKEL